MAEKKQLVVSAIKNGTVIDHIPARLLFNVIDILGLSHLENQITFGTNLESEKLGKKAIIKLSEVFFRKDDLDRIALVAPQAKINIIRDYEVVEKKVVEVPDIIEDIVKCVNPQCITNNQVVMTKFVVINKQPVTLKCHYCEKITNHNNLSIKNM
ncbi:MAG: aspartate carbamoyltransferase regulatory subunit [Bacteroidetes bacterium]|nr:aspartate carbamoyltransferase regulatory subunit [Bacteroidota bacterium]MBL7110537.1 aspartate carbamoyltransferase regulatory subunit [Bacteroidales bacterium]